MNTALAPQLTKLIPLLASDHDGEVIATARAIGRVLRASGYDWHDLAASIRLAPPISRLDRAPPRNPQPHPDLGWRQRARWCAQHAYLLGEREQNFIRNMVNWRAARLPTEAQLVWLVDIETRLRRRAAA